ncbi:MAG: putative bifunctional diguanylate cyclase/phosphodiesterase [Acidimicrobiales bacterium]
MSIGTERRHPAASVLGGHPIVIDVVRMARTLSGDDAEVVVFEHDHAMVVGGFGSAILQPRRLLAAEAALVELGRGRARAGGWTAVAIHDPDAGLVGSLSVRSGEQVGADVLHGLARLCGTALGMQPSNTGELAAGIVDAMRDAVVVIGADLRFRYASRATATLLGRPPSELVGTEVVTLVHPDDVEETLAAMVRLSNGDQVYRLMIRVLDGTGRYVRVEATGNDRIADPVVGGLVVSLRSGDTDVEMLYDMRRTRQVANAALEQLHDGVIAVAELGTALVVNDAARSLLGLPAGLPTPELDVDSVRFHDEDGRVLAAGEHPLRRIAAGERLNDHRVSVVAGGVMRHLVVNGRPIVDGDQAIIGAVLGLHDVTETRRAEQELRRRALHDQLTGLANRRQLEEHLAAVAADGSDPRLIAGCLIDLDNFKLINDTHGHRTGDAVIRGVADRLFSATSRPGDLLVRLGGDEFLLLARVATTAEALERAEEVRTRLAAPLLARERQFTLSCSIGVGLIRPVGIEEDALLKEADIALYAAKARGRDCVVMYDAELAGLAEVEARQRELLRRAIDLNQLVMHFQPLVDAATGVVVGFEALARCVDEDGNLMPPSAFLAAAEGSGLVWEFDRKAFELTCRAAARLRAVAPTLRVAANFSALRILQPDFCAVVLDTIALHRLDTAAIWVEISESAAFDVGDIATDHLRTLAEAGVSLALDDFGTGYSSLSHLRELPLAAVKVDRSFVARLNPGTTEHSIAKAVVSLASDLGLGVVAEGVETDEQRAEARSVGFTELQGWHYAPALSLEQILEDLGDAGPEGAAVTNRPTPSRPAPPVTGTSS